MNTSSNFQIREYNLFFLKWNFFVSLDTDNAVQNVHLVDGVSNSSGRIELLVNGRWGTVNEDGWNVNASNVVCRQLGYSAAVVTYKYAFFGEGSEVTWLTNVYCNGSESSLSECTGQYIGVLDDNHRKDVGVLCGSKENVYCGIHHSLSILVNLERTLYIFINETYQNEKENFQPHSNWIIPIKY